MKKPDARTLPIATQNYLRQQGIRLREQGKRVKAISEYLGVNRSTVGKWWRQYKQRGAAALTQQKRGHQIGEGRTLSPSMEKEIAEAVRDTYSEDYEIDSALWTRRAVQALIDQRYGIKMPIRTVGEYLKRWGYSPQRPLKQAYEQDPKAIETWLKEVYPAIVQRAKAEGAEIHWEDESGVHSNEYGGRGYAPRGHPPTIHPSERKRVKVNYIATLSQSGKVRFMLYIDNFTGPVYIQFLERLLAPTLWEGSCVAMDNFRSHHMDGVQAAIEAVGEKLVYLSPYSPDFSPIENCWSKLKASLRTQAARTYDTLNDAISRAIDGISKQDIIGWFTHCCYCSQPN